MPAPKAKKKRVDILLVERGLVESRTRAQALIMAGKVFLPDRRIDKPGESIREDLTLTVKERDHPWVSRGGLKLVHAIEALDLDVRNAVCIDVGASTGGFTDVLLTHGAKKVFAVDVGQGQLDWRLRQDDRVIVLEKTNARYLDQSLIPDAIDIIVCDASFIGLRTVLPASLELLKAGGWAIALIKPQFEVGKDRVGKGGVVRDPDLHQEVCDTIQHWFEADLCWKVLTVIESPILGPEGNKEFLIVAEKPAINEQPS